MRHEHLVYRGRSVFIRGCVDGSIESLEHLADCPFFKVAVLALKQVAHQFIMTLIIHRHLRIYCVFILTVLSNWTNRRIDGS